MILIEIKYDRLSEPERFLLDIFDGLEEYVNNDDPNIIFYKKDGMVMFGYDTKTHHISYSFDFIWVNFRDSFSFKYQEANVLVQSMVETNLNLKVNTASAVYLIAFDRVETNLKLKVNTTISH